MTIEIKSITDVITNSSTECFILNTDKSLEEVSATLKEITTGYREPEILKKGEGILDALVDGWDYLLDPDRNLANFYLSEVFGWEHKSITRAWKKFVLGNADKVNKHLEDHGYKYYLIYSEDDVSSLYYSEMLPKGFVEEFLKSYKGSYKVDEEDTVDFWDGKIGFLSESDNTIPYETWERIEQELNASRFHLG